MYTAFWVLINLVSLLLSILHVVLFYKKAKDKIRKLKVVDKEGHYARLNCVNNHEGSNIKWEVVSDFELTKRNCEYIRKGIEYSRIKELQIAQL